MTKLHLCIPYVVLFLLPGCLTVAEKEYHFRLNTDYSGTATIRFIDIGSESEDTTDISREDFEHLITFYLEGTQFEEQNPGFRDVEKKLYEEKGRLIGEIRFTFDSLQAVKLFRFDPSSPYMYYIGNDVFAEELAETNGKFNRDVMPVVFWAPGEKEFFLRTRVASETPGRRGLIEHFREWESSRSKVSPDREN